MKAIAYGRCDIDALREMDANAKRFAEIPYVNYETGEEYRLTKSEILTALVLVAKEGQAS